MTPRTDTTQSHPYRAGHSDYAQLGDALEHVAVMHRRNVDVADVFIVDRRTGERIYDGGLHRVVDGVIVPFESAPAGTLNVAMRDLEGHGNTAGR